MVWPEPVALGRPRPRTRHETPPGAASQGDLAGPRRCRPSGGGFRSHGPVRAGTPQAMGVPTVLAKALAGRGFTACESPEACAQVLATSLRPKVANQLINYIKQDPPIPPG